MAIDSLIPSQVRDLYSNEATGVPSFLGIFFYLSHARSGALPCRVHHRNRLLRENSAHALYRTPMHYNFLAHLSDPTAESTFYRRVAHDSGSTCLAALKSR